jgi:hypothetical protein
MHAYVHYHADTTTPLWLLMCFAGAAIRLCVSTHSCVNAVLAAVMPVADVQVVNVVAVKLLQRKQHRRSS